MLQAFGLSYEPSPIAGELFSDLNLSIDAGERVVLVGNNGSGKTCLLEILAGLREPTSGRVVLDSKASIGYLPQDIDLDFRGTLTEFLLHHPDPVQEAAIKRVCQRLGLDTSQLEVPYPKLSVGERVRAALARVLLDEPNVLLLDEPTNHLDIDGRRWLIEFLNSTRCAILMVCHDRTVVNEVADRVLELAQGSLNEYTGNYDDMVTARELRDARLKGEHERQVQEERKLKNAVEQQLQRASRMTRKPTQRTYDPKAKAFYAAKESKLDKRAKAIQSRAEQLKARIVDKPFESDSVAIEFPAKPLRHANTLTVRGLRKAFGGRELFEGLSFTLERGARLAVVGANGSGKTSLFRILLEEQAPDRGEFTWSPEAVVGYLSQERTTLDLDVPLLQALDPTGESQTRFVRTLLARLRIRGEAVRKPMRALSVGERTKAELVAVLMTEANVLLLDEPTNHLDVDSLDALEEALKLFPGSVIFTSHDQAFIERTATQIIVLQAK